MTQQQWQDVWAVFRAAADLPKTEQRRFVEQSLQNPDLRAKVAELLAELEPPAEESSEQTSQPQWPRIGQTLGRFEMRSPLGRGGMGDVYRAYDPALDREVAIKCVAPANLGSSNAIADFLREARAASALNHPGIVTIYEVVRTEDNVAIVMELVDGEPLRTFAETPQPIQRVADWGRQIAEALAASHGRAMIHRDIKPENIMIRPDDYAKVLDFGLAQSTSAPIENLPLGTVRYMSPEQARASQITPASDVFSLGVVLYELATGVHPFAGAEGHRDTTMAITQSIVRQTVRAPSKIVAGLPHEFDVLIARMLAKDRALRPSARDVVQSLEKLLHRKRGWLNPLTLTATAVAAAGLLAVAVWIAQRPSPPPAALKTVSFTTYSGSASQPDFSRDGSRIVFTWTGPDESNQDIYWKTVGEETPHRLTTNPADDFAPAYSPDMKWIAFLRNPSAEGVTQVWIVPAQGGEERMVGETQMLGDIRGLTWWPDGQSLLVRDSVAVNGTLVRLFLSDGHKTQFSSPPDSQADGLPKISPTGKRVAFLRYRTDGNDLCWTELSGGPVHCLDHGTIQAIAWDRSGDYLYYTDSAAMWRIGLLGRTSDHPVKIADGIFLWLASDPSSPRLAYCRTVNDSNIWKMGRHGENPHRLIASSSQDNEALWSPDGSRILMRSNRSGHYELYTYNPDGADERQLTHWGAFVGSARWSPDGAWVAFDGLRTTVDPNEKHHDIYVVPAAGGPYRRITDDRYHAITPSWSPSGKEIYYIECTVPHRMRRMPLAGGTAAAAGDEIDDLTFSGPENFSYFVTNRRIMRRPVSGGSATVLAAPRGLALYHYWDVTQHGLYFVDGPPHPTLHYLDFATNRTETLAELPNKLLIGIRNGLSVSPDEKSIVYTLNDISISDILLITNLKN